MPGACREKDEQWNDELVTEGVAMKYDIEVRDWEHVVSSNDDFA